MSLPHGEGFGLRIVTGGNPRRGPHQCAHWFAMTAPIQVRMVRNDMCLFRCRKSGRPMAALALWFPLFADAQKFRRVYRGIIFGDPEVDVASRVLSTNAVSEA